MTLIEILLADHDYFRIYLVQVLEVSNVPSAEGDSFSANALPGVFSSRLRRHARIENEVLFPALQSVGSDDSRRKSVVNFIHHGIDEHVSVAKKSAELNHALEKNGPDDHWRKSLERFAEGLDLHFRKEETGIFPMAQALLSRDLLVELAKKAEAIP